MDKFANSNTKPHRFSFLSSVKDKKIISSTKIEIFIHYKICTTILYFTNALING